MKTAFLIAAPTSGSGKTTIARGLMALFTEKGYTVQPFKCGPDYIDTKFHEAVCGRPSVNLDTFMATPEHVRELFFRYGDHADVCIAEGMMGLFDGYDRDRGSSAEIARTLGIPVILVVDAKSAAYSMAPLLKGFLQFDPQVRCCGVIFNKVGSERHYAMLQQVCQDVGIDCLGYLPKSQALETGSRYLGLDFSADSDNRELLRQIELHIDWKKLVTAGPEFGDGKPSVCYRQTNGFVTGNSPFGDSKPQDLKNVLIARNHESFSFLYTEVIDSFCHPQFFDPETAVPDLTHTDLLYLPGGYPEKHLEALVANEACREAIRDYALRGGRIVAECGGMMYLCQHIVTDEATHPMCGVLPFDISARQADRKLSLGYRRFTMGDKEYRGHEFHYTQMKPIPRMSEGHLQAKSATPYGEALTLIPVVDAKGKVVDNPVIIFKNVFASYTHLYHL